MIYEPYLDHESRKIGKVNLAYLAGFFDADGCVAVGEYTDDKKNRFYCAATVGQISREILNSYCSIFGGAVNRQTWTIEKNPQRRTNYSWRAAGKSGEMFFKTILPYLRQKQKQVYLALEFRKTIGLQGASASRKISVRKIRKDLIDEIRLLKRP